MKFFQLSIVSFLLLGLSVANVSCNSSKGAGKSDDSSFIGRIDYVILYDIPEEYKDQAGQLDTISTTYIGKDFTRIEQNTQNGEQVSIYDINTKSTTVLMSIMGKKIALLTEDPPAEEMPIYEIKELDEKKEIAGYLCKKAIFTAIRGEQKTDYHLFYTEKISPDANSQFPDLKGFPLEYTIDAQGVVVTYRAQKLTHMKVGQSLKEVPDSYESMTVEEFMKLVGGG